ncbi:hypothetical protein [Paenibacillus validus]|uniref:hypothetical protein n=1 Tax=Paenibacillus validus TaxID=44253 RepID=UPI003D2DCFA4
MKWLIMAGVLLVLAALAGAKIWTERKKERERIAKRWEERWAQKQRHYEEQEARLAALTPEERQERIDDMIYRRNRTRQRQIQALKDRRAAVAAAREAREAEGGEHDAAAR